MELDLINSLSGLFKSLESNPTSNVVVLALATHLTFSHRHEDIHSPITALLLFLLHIAYALFCVQSKSDAIQALNLFIPSFALFHLTLFSSITIYRVIFHRTRSYPGPLGAKVTKWYLAWIAYGGKQHLRLHELHSQYGPVVRIGPRDLSFNSSAAYLAIYGPNSPCTRSALYAVNNTKKEWNLNSTFDKTKHHKRRKLWEKAFASKSMNEYYPRVLAQTNNLLSQMTKATSSPMLIGKLFDHYVMSVIGKVGFSMDFPTDDGASNYFSPPASLLKQVFWPRPLSEMTWLIRVLHKYVPVETLNNAYRQIGRRINKEREIMKPDHPDIYHWISQRETDGLKVTEDVINADIVLLLIAGIHTTSTTICNVLYHLAKYPQYAEAIQSDIDKTFKNEQQFNDYANFTNLPHLEAVINETLRLFPIIPRGFERVTPSEGMMIGGEHIPGNVIVRVPLWTIQRNEELFPRPEEFLPERWTKRSEDLLQKGAAFYPFSLGRDSCVGKNLAMMEIRLVIVNILRKFDIKAASQEQLEKYPDFGEAVIAYPNDLELIFTEREKQD